MTPLKKLLFPLFVLLALLNPKADAQIIQEVTPNNAIESANEIKDMFGELINVSPEEILNFYLNQWDSHPYSAQCINPEASLLDMDDQSASFEWDHVGDQSYIVSYLRLSDGTISTQNTSNNSFEFNIPNDLYLVTFQSRCSSGYKSTLGLIIIEKAVMFTSAEDCFCQNYTSVWVAQFSNTSGTNQVAQYPWPPGTTDGEYFCSINYDDGATASFHASIEFNSNYKPSIVTLAQQCMVNIDLNSDNTLVYALDPNQGPNVRGNFTFHSNAAFTFTPQNGSSGSIKLSRCSRKIKRDRDSFDEKNSGILEFESTLNPFSSYTTIRYKLPERQNVSIHLFNAYGQAIKIIKDQELTEAGIHQMNLDLSDLPNGVYLCILKTQNQSIPLKLLKTQ